MKRFEYDGVKYVADIREEDGYAYPCIYKESKWLWFVSKKLVYTQSGISWPWQYAITSRPDQIESAYNTVISFFKSYKKEWEGKDNPFSEA